MRHSRRPHARRARDPGRQRTQPQSARSAGTGPLRDRDAGRRGESWSERRPKGFGFEVDFFQSNSEGAILDKLHAARGVATGVIINPGGLTSTSISLLDALLAVDLPTVEVHVTSIHRREAFRHNSYVSGVAVAVIAGAGIAGYGMAAEVIARIASPDGYGLTE